MFSEKKAQKPIEVLVCDLNKTYPNSTYSRSKIDLITSVERTREMRRGPLDISDYVNLNGRDIKPDVFLTQGPAKIGKFSNYLSELKLGSNDLAILANTITLDLPSIYSSGIKKEFADLDKNYFDQNFISGNSIKTYEVNPSHNCQHFEMRKNNNGKYKLKSFDISGEHAIEDIDIKKDAVVVYKRKKKDNSKRIEVYKTKIFSPSEYIGPKHEVAAYLKDVLDGFGIKMKESSKSKNRHDNKNLDDLTNNYWKHNPLGENTGRFVHYPTDKYGDREKIIVEYNKLADGKRGSFVSVNVFVYPSSTTNQAKHVLGTLNTQPRDWKSETLKQYNNLVKNLPWKMNEPFSRQLLQENMPYLKQIHEKSKARVNKGTSQYQLGIFDMLPDKEVVMALPPEMFTGYSGKSKSNTFFSYADRKNA